MTHTKFLNADDWTADYANTPDRVLVLSKSTMRAQASLFLERFDKSQPSIATTLLCDIISHFQSYKLEGTFELYPLENGHHIILLFGKDRTCAVGRITEDIPSHPHIQSRSRDHIRKRYSQTVTFSPFVFALNKTYTYTFQKNPSYDFSDVTRPFNNITFPDLKLSDLYHDMQDALSLIEKVGPFVNISHADTYPGFPVSPWENTDTTNEDFITLLKELTKGFFLAKNIPDVKGTIRGRLLFDTGSVGDIESTQYALNGNSNKQAEINKLGPWLNAVCALPDFPISLYQQTAFATKLAGNAKSKISRKQTLTLYSFQNRQESAHINIKALSTFQYWNERYMRAYT
jgi:hypothetical protein